MKDSILNTEISCFASCDSPIPKRINFLTWLTSDKHRDRVEHLRRIQDETLQNVLKKSLPAITPSGLFEYRDEKHLIKHSGFLAFDIDFKDNKHIDNFADLKNEIKKIVNVAYCGLSVRGKGFWGCVPIPESTPDIHRLRFQALEKDFKEFGINLDPSGKDVCRLRIYSWDPEPYINHQAKKYNKVYKPEPKKFSRPSFSDTRSKVELIIREIISTGTDITGVYDDWLKIACGLANEFGESGRGYFHSISKYHPEYNITKTDRMFDEVLKHEYRKVTIASFFKIAQDYGLSNIKDHADSNPVITPINTPLPTPGNCAIDTYTGVNVTSEVRCSTPVKHQSVIKSGPWSSEIEELQRFFDSVSLPSECRLDPCTRINNIPLFLESHISTVLHQNGNERYLPYMERLRTLEKSLKNEQQN